MKNMSGLLHLKCLTASFLLSFVVLYFVAPDWVVVDQNKLDTLYMVSTIFFSAAIGMVISNNVHLEYQQNKVKIRQLNKRMTRRFIALFIVETIAYFYYNESVAHALGLHMHLIVLGLVIYASLYFVLSMPMVSRAIAEVEDCDFGDQETSSHDKRNIKLRQNLMTYCDEPRSKQSIINYLQVSDEEYSQIIDPLLEGCSVVEYGGNVCTSEYVKKILCNRCAHELMSMSDLAKNLCVDAEVLADLVGELVSDKKLFCMGDKCISTLSDYVESLSSKVLELCHNNPSTRHYIFKHIELENSSENYRLFLKPLIDSGQLVRVGGTGYGAKYQSRD